MSSELARVQVHPRNVRVSDFADTLKAVFKPLFILDRLDMEVHIRGAFKILYKALYIENPADAQSKYQELIRTTLAAYSGIQRDVRYLFYPLLMKTVSASFVPYGIFFQERKNRIMHFLNVNESDQLNPAVMTMQVDDSETNGEEVPEEKADQKQDEQPEESQTQEDSEQEKTAPEQTEKTPEEEKSRPSPEESDKKALERGLSTLELLFPKAGWDKISSYPDLYPYFVGEFGLRRGFVNIAPTDPMHQVYVLMRILEELFFGLRYVSFGTVPGLSGNMERVDVILGDVINNWHYYLDTGFDKEYFPRMSEYIRILEGSFEERNSAYTKRLVSELHWIKRLYLLPFYKFSSFLQAPVHKKDAIPVYTKIKTLRKYLSAVAAGIEQANKAGGAEAHASCDGIDNPWEPYVFQVPNPVSKRLDAFLKPKVKNNASLIYFCLAITAVLDYLVNNENSWAYGDRPGPLFRSVNGEGAMPLTGVDDRVDADALFKQALKQRQKKE